MKLEPPSLSSRDVDRFLVSFHGVSPDEQEGYVQRLRSITRMGFPAGLSAGKGHPARYDASQFFQLFAVSELYRCYVPPLQAVRLVETSWAAMKASILDVWDSVDAAEHGHELDLPRRFWRIPAEGGQRQTRAEGATLPPAQEITVISREAVTHQIDDRGLLAHCHIFIDVSKLIGGVFKHLKFGSDPMTPDKIACFMSGMDRA